MAKRLDHTAVLDVALSAIKSGAIRLIFCSADPVNYAGIAAVTLVTQTISSASMTLSDASPNGRQVTVAAQTNMTVSANGTIMYAVLTDNSSILYGGTTVSAQPVTTSVLWNSPSFTISIADPV